MVAIWILTCVLLGADHFLETARLAGVTDEDVIGRGVAFADLDGDGLSDIVVANATAPNRLFKNLGLGPTGIPRFEDRAAAWGVTPQEPTFAAIPADFDNDGDLDLFFANGGFSLPIANRLYLNQLDFDGRFLDVSLVSGIGADVATSFAGAWSDFDLDGRLDLFVANRTFPDRLYRNLDGLRFEDCSAAAGVDDAGMAVSCTWLDFNNDGWPDLFVSRIGQTNLLYRNRGDGTFEEMAAPAGVSEPLESFSCLAGDFDANGWIDLCVSPWAQRGDERLRLYLNQAGTFSDVAASAGVDVSAAVLSLQSEDLDGDGDLDLFLGCGQPSSADPDFVFRNDLDRVTGILRFTDVSSAWGFRSLEPVRSHGVAMGDPDGDGDLDIYVGAGGMGGFTAEPNRFYLNNHSQEGAPLARIELRGVRSNRRGVGAQVRSCSDSLMVHRVLGAGNGFGSANEPAIFLPIRSPTLLLVLWPAGGTQVVPVVPSTSRLTIIEKPSVLLPWPFSSAARDH
ncbi:MAG: VCBS repeat-containing protein [Planctomycetota bacterium]